MNLQKLFKIQAILDKHILDKHNLHAEDLLDKKILALQVELGELAQNWRGFKFWSKDQEPRNQDIKCHSCKGKGYFDFTTTFTGEHYTEDCGYCDGTGIQEKNPLLEEYVDCLHFILSIGNDLKYEYESIAINPYDKYSLTYLFNSMFYQVVMFEEKKDRIGYELMFNVFLSLSVRLGFTWEQIEAAYFAKNKINHERQEQGY